MLPNDIWDRLPIFLIFIAFALMIIPKIAEASEPISKWFGPLGRKWRERAQIREDFIARKRMEQNRELIGEVIAQQPVIDVIRKQLTSVIDRLTTLEEVVTIQRGFIAYDEQWHFEANLKAAQQGRLPEPRVSFNEFTIKWKQGWRPEEDMRG